MTDLQLYLAMGIPTFAILITLVAGIVQNSATNNSIAARFTSLETNMNARFASVDNRFTSIDNAFAACYTRLVRARISGEPAYHCGPEAEP